MSISSLNWGMILGGFGLFMFGIHFMGDGLKAVAGDGLRDLINRFTSSPLKATFVGILITMFLQSSSATTAITISLVRSGLMTFEQSIGIVLGANVGTTITSFLISMSLDRYAMFIVFVGTMLICFGKKKTYIYIGDIILGFGLIFYGMSAMGDSLAAIKESPEFAQLAVTLGNTPILAMLTGIVMTAMIQSSDATIGIIQKLYQADAISFMVALPFMFGAYIGTTITGILASLGGAPSGKRTAIVHMTINIIGSTVGMLLLVPFSNLILSLFGDVNPMMQVAFANIIFKVVTAICFLPFTKQLAKIAKTIIPEAEDESVDINVDELDASVTSVLPSTAVQASQQAILKMVDLVRYNTLKTQEFFNEKGGETEKDKIDKNESIINRFDQKITNYLIRLSNQPGITAMNADDVRLQLDSVKNIERIGDLSCNLVEFYLMVYEKNEDFTDYAKEEVSAMYQKLIEMFDYTAEIFVTRDEKQYEQLQKMELELDDLEIQYRNAHFNRMRDNVCSSPIAESIYCDILGTLERMGDHCCNVAKSAITKLTSDLSDDEVVAKHIRI